MRMPASGVDGTFMVWQASPSRFRMRASFGPFGASELVVDGDHGAEKSDFTPDRILDGTELVLVKTASPGLPVYWPDLFETMVVEEWAEVDGEQAVKVTATPQGFDQPFVLYIDPATGLVRKVKGWIFAPNIGPYPMGWAFDAPSEIDGRPFIMGWRSISQDTGNTLFEVMDVSSVPMTPGMFQMDLDAESR